MQIDGIKGQVTAKKYQDWIELHSFDFSVGCSIHTTVGRKCERRGCMPNFSNVMLSKAIDKTSPLLFQAACKGSPHSTILIHACRGLDKPETYLEYRLENCVICHYKNTGVAGLQSDEAMSEELEINFTKVSMRFIERETDNNNTKPLNAGYNLETADSV